MLKLHLELPGVVFNVEAPILILMKCNACHWG